MEQIDLSTPLADGPASASDTEKSSAQAVPPQVPLHMPPPAYAVVQHPPVESIVSFFNNPANLATFHNQEAVRRRTDCMPAKWHLGESYLLCVPFAGFLGMQHFYLRRPGWGVLYLCTFALLGCGWIWDLLRMPWLIKSAKRDTTLRRCYAFYRQALPDQALCSSDEYAQRLTTSDALILAFPCGLFGFHHWYLKQRGWAVLYLCTLGLLGCGFLYDLFRMPCLVAEANKTHYPREREAQDEALLDLVKEGDAPTRHLGAEEIPCALPVQQDSV